MTHPTDEKKRAALEALEANPWGSGFVSGGLNVLEINETIKAALRAQAAPVDAEVQHAIYLCEIAANPITKGIKEEALQNAVKTLIRAATKPAVPQEVIEAVELKWCSSNDEFHREVFTAYIEALPHSVGTRKACYTVRKDRYSGKWDCCFWVGNMGHCLLGNIFNMPTMQSAMTACQDDFNKRVSLMLLSRKQATNLHARICLRIS